MIQTLTAPPEPLSQKIGFTKTSDSDLLGTGFVLRGVD
jgi:hypothetical protein